MTARGMSRAQAIDLLARIKHSYSDAVLDIGHTRRGHWYVSMRHPTLHHIHYNIAAPEQWDDIAQRIRQGKP